MRFEYCAKVLKFAIAFGLFQTSKSNAACEVFESHEIDQWLSTVTWEVPHVHKSVSIIYPRLSDVHLWDLYHFSSGRSSESLAGQQTPEHVSEFELFVEKNYLGTFPPKVHTKLKSIIPKLDISRLKIGETIDSLRRRPKWSLSGRRLFSAENRSKVMTGSVKMYNLSTEQPEIFPSAPLFSSNAQNRNYLKSFLEAQETGAELKLLGALNVKKELDPKRKALTRKLLGFWIHNQIKGDSARTKVFAVVLSEGHEQLYAPWEFKVWEGVKRKKRYPLIIYKDAPSLDAILLKNFPSIAASREENSNE